jgi:hypothetical protein
LPGHIDATSDYVAFPIAHQPNDWANQMTLAELTQQVDHARRLHLDAHVEETMRTGVAVAISAGLIGLGLVLGLSPGSAQGATKEFSCGSPWNMDTKEISHQQYIDDLANSMHGSEVWATDYRQRCEDELGTRGIAAWILTGLGALALVGVAVTRRPAVQAADPAPES